MRTILSALGRCKGLLLAIGLTSSLSGCVRQSAFLQVVVCVVDQQGVEEFKDFFREAMEYENLKYADGSQDLAEYYRKMKLDKRQKFDASLTVDLGAHQPGGPYVSAGNLLEWQRPYQMYVGFLEGWRPAKAHRLADRVVAEVSKRWRVEVTPEGQGSLPMKGCDG